MRWLRLILGVFIAAQAIDTRDPISGMIAIFFIFQAVTNTGCCGVNACAVPASKPCLNNIEEIEFEEIKTKQNGAS